MVFYANFSDPQVQQTKFEKRETFIMTKSALLPPWISYWATIASALVLLDCIYVFSQAYGIYSPEIIQKLWKWYASSDTQYSTAGIKSRYIYQTFHLFHYTE